MPQDNYALAEPFDSGVVKLIEELRAYAHEHPAATSATLALEGILDRLIDQALRSGTAADGDLPAISSLEQLATIFPDSPKPWLYLSKLSVDRGDHQRGLQCAESGLQVEPSHPGLTFNRALCLLHMDNSQAAIDEFRRYIELEPGNPWAYNNIGDAYRRMKVYDLAENYLQLAIEHDRKFAPAHRNLALLYLDQRAWRQCIYHAQAAARLGPFDNELHLTLGDAHMGLGDPRNALSHLIWATLVDKGFVEAYETMSAAYADLRMFELSRAAAREALRLNPQSWMAQANIGYSYSKEGLFNEAVEPLLEALERGPDEEGEYKILWQLGWAYLWLGENGKALEYTELAVQRKEYPDLILLFNRGLVLAAQGNWETSDHAYAAAETRARAMDKPSVILEAIADAKELISKKGLKVKSGSRLAWLLEGMLES